MILTLFKSQTFKFTYCYHIFFCLDVSNVLCFRFLVCWKGFDFSHSQITDDNRLFILFCQKHCGKRRNNLLCIFSSPEHKVLKVSYCDRLSSSVRRQSSVNFFSSVTSGSFGMKLHRQHPLNDLIRIPSLGSIQNSGFHGNINKTKKL